MENTEYTKEYFIKKFEAIPDELWTTRVLTHPSNNYCHCALGHCGVLNALTYEMTKESLALSTLLTPIFGMGSEKETIYEINDNMIELGSTPKERILTALRMVE